MPCSEIWRDRLYTPTMIQKVGSDYFIVDCWHNRVLYSRNVHAPITNWKTLSEEIFGGHTVSSDGRYIICDNTDKDEIAIFERRRCLLSRLCTGGGIN